MSILLEWKKIRRTGFSPAFLWGGVLSAAVPILNMAVRSELYLGLTTPPLEILLDANWQMMAMLNILLLAAGACLMYHTEFADNAISRMCTLPLSEARMFFGKTALMALFYLSVLLLEHAAVAFCIAHWFALSPELPLQILKNLACSFWLALPAVLSSLMIASAFRNMWLSLGIGVICVFLATMLPMDHFALSLFPFALPFQSFAGAPIDTLRSYAAAGGVEILIIALMETVFLKIRRCLA